MSDENRKSPETAAAQALHFIDPVSGGVIPPIQPSTNFARDNEYELIDPANSYSRDQNPGFRIAEKLLAELEGADDARLFASGMAAATAVLQSLRPGDHVVAPKVMYWGLRNWLQEFCSNWGLQLDLFDSTSEGGLTAKVRAGKTRLVWIETPCNPTWDIIDIAHAASIAHACGAVLVVDSTVATPVLTRPFEHGADIVMHSATKYLNGHGDVVAGALATAERSETWARILEVRAHGGAILGSFEAWLLQRGMRTLFLRVHKACESALLIAEHFHGHPKLDAVLYPGLPSHPGHAVAAGQMRGGFGGMLSVRVKGGAETALAVANRCEVFIRATSLGGVESLIEHRHTIEGPASPIPPELLRLSIGIEAVDDLVTDLEQALARV
jgi:cystathionine gamma-synthase